MRRDSGTNLLKLQSQISVTLQKCHTIPSTKLQAGADEAVVVRGYVGKTGSLNLPLWHTEPHCTEWKLKCMI